jgi:hypothetical protein
MSNQPPITLGAVARRHGIPGWMVRRVYERKLLPEAARLGPWRVVYPDQLPALEAALRQAGYLPPAGEGGRDAA